MSHSTDMSRLSYLQLAVILVFALQIVLLAFPFATYAGGHPAQKLTNDYVPSLLSPADARCLVAGANGTFHVVWYDSSDGDYEIYYRYFDGISWLPEVKVTTNSSNSVTPGMAIDASGKLYLVWSDIEDGTYEIYYKTRDGGTWSASTKLSGGGAAAETPVIAVDHAGAVHVVWREYRAGSWGLYYKRFEGSAWSASEILTPAGAYPRFPCISVDLANNVHLVWQDARVPTNTEIYYRKRGATGWEPEIKLTDAAGLSELPSVTIDSGGDVHVFWDDARSGTSEIYHKICEAGIWGDDRLFASLSYDLRGPSSCADADGHLYVAWYAITGQSMNAVYWSKSDGPVWFPPEQVASPKGGSLNPCIASHDDGLIGIVWMDRDDGDEEVWWRLYEEFGPKPTLSSIEPAAWRAYEASPIQITGNGFGADMKAWLCSAGGDSTPLLNLTTLSPTSMSGWLDLGPSPAGYRDVVIETFAGGRDTLVAGFLLEESKWGPDVRLTNQTAISGFSYANARRVAVDSDGNITVVWCDKRDGTNRVYYKRCEAGVWGPDTRLSGLTNAAQAPAIAVDSDDRLHVVWMENPLGNWEIYYKRYDGAVWDADLRLTVSMGNSQYPAIAVTPIGTLYVVWQDDRLTSGNFDIYVTHFNGVDWRPDSLLYDGTLSATTPTVAADNRGRVHVAWCEGGNISNARLMYRKFNGASWETAQELAVARAVGSPSIAAGSDGSVHVAWFDRRYEAAEGSYEIFYRRSDGYTWDPEQRLTAAPDSSTNPSVTVAPDGMVHVFWADRRWGNKEIFHSYFYGTAWSNNARLTNDPKDSNLPSATYDAAGNLHVVWQDSRDGNYEIYYKMCEAGASSGVDVEVPGDPSDREASSLNAGPNPARAGTMLRISVVRESQVRVCVYDILGKLIWSREVGNKSPGRYEVPWDGRDLAGRAVSPGIYFAKMTSGREIAEAKIVVVK